MLIVLHACTYTGHITVVYLLLGDHKGCCSVSCNRNGSSGCSTETDSLSVSLSLRGNAPKLVHTPLTDKNAI